MVQSSNNTVNAIINNFNKASKKAQKNDTYTKTVKVTDDIRLIYDLGWLDNHYLGNIRIQQKQDNGRYATIGKWIWSNGDFENFVIRTFFSVAEEEVFDNAKTAICNEFGGTYDFESAIKSVMKKFDLLTEEEVRRAFEDVFGYSKNISR